MSSNSFLSIIWLYWIILLGVLVIADDSRGLTLPRMRRTSDAVNYINSENYVPSYGNHPSRNQQLWAYAQMLRSQPLDRRSLIYSPQGKDSYLRVLRSYDHMIKRLEENDEEDLDLKQTDKKWRIRLG
ncbi:uncharacterized protein [Lepeophtheirus salmonis]|uniref:uncharacterized protein n=1 Tax=Lepeophtheirus salmonis TaxID=72036 RepID=UPI001AE713F3|nr:uncharacterized protein LOC121131955 [Lepeophtheirus salmonis]